MRPAEASETARFEGAAGWLGPGCPECGAKLVHADACVRCRQCGFSPCG